MPKNICSSCLREVIQLHSFKEKCKQTEILLKSICETSGVFNATLTKTEEKEEQAESDGENHTENIESTKFDHDDVSNESDSSEQKISPRTTKKAHKSKRRRKPIKQYDSDCSSFKCRDCSESYTTRDKLKEHRKKVKHPEVRNHTCEICSKSFTSSKLRQHMRAHTKEKPYKCKECSQGFSMSGNLKRHMMTHTGERPHVCPVCGKGNFIIQLFKLQ